MAVEHLRSQSGCRDYNLILEIAQPMSLNARDKLICSKVDEFLVSNGMQSVSTVINTIFPASLYMKHGAKKLFEEYREIAPKLRKHPNIHWGTYFMRMIGRTDPKGAEIRPLEYVIEKLRRQAKVRAPKRGVYEINLIEPFTDIPIYEASSDKHYHMGGPCLSHISFKLRGDNRLLLTAIYRSHYYVERALGNLYGLALLQDCVAREAGVETGELVCHSTMAILDTDKAGKRDIVNLLRSLKGARVT
jgi:hypothetical protein